MINLATYVYAALIGGTIGAVLGYHFGSGTTYKRMVQPMFKRLIDIVRDSNRVVQSMNQRLTRSEILHPEDLMERPPCECPECVTAAAPVLPDALVRQYDQSGTLINHYER